jgi:cell division protein FtsI (penicillin-binding protein 3)
MGLTKPLGFQMIGEGLPKVKSPDDKSWSGTTLPWMSIGYEVELTPLHTLAFYNAVANEGKMIQPIIVKRAFKADKVKEVYEAGVIKEKICSDETLEKVKIMLKGVVERGTADNIKNSHYSIAGKTGTSLILKNGRYTRNYYTSFAGYFPADRPRYSCIVVINDPKGFQQYGSDVAAPVFKEIADKIYARDIEMHPPFPTEAIATSEGLPVIKAGMHEDLKLICNILGISNSSENQTEEWVKVSNNNNSVVWEPNRLDLDKVPDVKGLTLKDALYMLENKGLRVEYQGKGRVVNQSQVPGSKTIKGSIITIKLS